MNLDEQFAKAARAIRSADAMVVTAGAGMGVDSGLPDFRGNQGFWNAYPMYERLGYSFIDAANPANFEGDPAFGWGFYGHRTNLYRETAPHRGFRMLQDWAGHFGQDSFVVTSNVDGQFQKAGYGEDQVLEVHGSIHHLQCLTPCCNEIWENNETIPVDFDTMRAEQVPACRFCRSAARPNILMFGDYSWLPNRTRGQEMRFDSFLNQHRDAALVIIEMGAGTAIPTIRHLSESLGQRTRAKVVRINPREAHIGGGHVALPCRGLEGLDGIEEALGLS
ncbi:MAG TPA: Sir2 family NAD-dependent protein deacetylase [Desulfuromonadales bacterium]|nr:Sir2 family NAD-dependent protein deacetylase [Desulfuromonadales bacterium]